MSSFSSIAPFSIYPHRAIQQPHQNFSVEVMIDCVITDPACLEDWISKLLGEKDAARYFSHFVEEIGRELNGDPVLLSTHLDACLTLIELKKLSVIRSVFMDQPLAFSHLLLALDPDRRKAFIQQLGHIMRSDEWEKAFLQVLECVREEEGLDMAQQRNHFAALINSLSKKQMKALIRLCVSSWPVEGYATLVTAVTQQWAKYALNIFAEHHSLESSSENYLALINALSREMPYHTILEDLLKHILQLYRHQNKEHYLTDQFKYLSAKSRVNMLSVMSYDQRKGVLVQESHNIKLLCNWLDELYGRVKDYEGRKRLFQVFYNRMLNAKKEDFLQTLHSMGSQALAFMLVCLEPQEVKEVLLASSANRRTQLFSVLKMDSTTRELLGEITGDNRLTNGTDRSKNIKAFLYSTMLLDMTTDLIDVEEGISIEKCGDYLQLMATYGNELEVNYISFIAKIPPFLIGIACSDPADRATFLKLARYLTEEQLKFLVLSIGSDDTYQVIQPLLAKLRTDQFKTILDAFSEEQLVNYADKSVRALQEAYAEYERTLNQLLLDLEKSTGSRQMISLAEYEDYQRRTRELTGLGRTSFNLQTYRLLRHLEALGTLYPHPNTLVSLKQMVEKYERRKQLIEGGASLVFRQVEALEALINPDERQEDYDPFSCIYEGFWSSLPAAVLESIGIFPNSPSGVENLGQLQLVGIKTNEDLHYLLISKERQTFIEQLTHKMRGLFTNRVKEKVADSSSSYSEEELTTQWQEAWNTFFNPALSREEAQPALQELVQFLDFSFQEEKWTLLVTEICLELTKFEDLPTSQKQFFERCSTKFRESDSKLAKVYQSLTRRGLEIIRKRQIIFCLQSYFKQGSELKMAWEKLREYGCYTIEDLFDKKLVKAHSQMMDLNEVVKKLK